MSGTRPAIGLAFVASCLLVASASACQGPRAVPCGDGTWCAANQVCLSADAPGGAPVCGWASDGCGGQEDGERCAGDAPSACVAGTCVPLGCGDGLVGTGEACDTGAANSDINPDACRSSCRAAGCGDRVVDQGEQRGCFVDPPALLAAGAVRDLLAADFDGDGKLDFATLPAAGASGARAWRRTGPTTHEPIDLSFVGARAMTHGDLDHDGDQELVLLSDTQLAIFDVEANPGQPRVTLDGAFADTSLACADVDGDAGDELLLGAKDLTVVRLLAGGTLEQKVQLRSTPIRRMVAADANGDGSTDLILVEGSAGAQTICIAHNDTAGAFEDPPGYDMARGLTNVTAIAAGNLQGDQDNQPDVAWTVAGSSKVFISPNGGFVDTMTHALEVASPWPAAQLDVVDADGDDRDDLEVHAPGGMGVIFGWSDAPSAVLALSPTLPGRLVDLDDDDFPDLALFDSDVLVQAGGDGPLGRPRQPGAYTRTPALADLDGDVYPDLLMGGGGGLTMRLGQASGLGPERVAAQQSSLDILVLDWDGDGDDDAVVLVPFVETRFLAAMQNDGLQGFRKTEEWGAFASTPAWAVADLNRDGTDEMVLCKDAATLLSAPFAASAGTRLTPVSEGCGPILVADLDGDDLPDLLLASSSLRFHPGTDTGTRISEAGQLWLDEPVSGLSLAHDAAGAAWLAVSVAATGSVALYPIEAGQLGAPMQCPGFFAGATSPRAADLNGDGVLDVVFARQRADDAELWVALGDGHGGLAKAQLVGRSTGWNRLDLGDLGADGCVDVFTGGQRALWWRAR